MSYPYRNPAYPPAGYPPQGNPMYPGSNYPPQNPPPAGYAPQVNPMYPGSSYPPQSNAPYPGGDFQQQGNSPYPSSGYPPQGNSPYPNPGYPTQGNLPYPVGPYPSNPPSVGYNPTMGNTPYLPAGYPTFEPQPSAYPPNPNPGYSAVPDASATNIYPSSSGGYPAGSPAYPTSSYSGPTENPQNSSKRSPYPTNSSSTVPQNNRSMANYEGQGTVVPYPGFDPSVDAQALRKAMKGFGTDEKAIISILANRSNSQRVYITGIFKQQFGKNLIDDLKSELSGKFEDVILGLMTPLSDYLAQEAHRAMSGIGTDEDALMEILCTRTNREIWDINEAYNRLYGKSIEDAIIGDTSGHFRRLLVSSCTGARSEAPADPQTAVQDAHALFQAGVGVWGTDESAFNAILCAKSFHHLSLVFYEYQKLAGHTVVQAIQNEMSGDLRDGMLAIARSVENRPAYFAEKLYRAMKGGGTDDRTLIRIIVSRCEIDMVQIRAEYERNHGKPLASAIADDTSGDYKRVLIALVSG